MSKMPTPKESDTKVFEVASFGNGHYINGKLESRELRKQRNEALTLATELESELDRIEKAIRDHCEDTWNNRPRASLCDFINEIEAILDNQPTESEAE
jgi:hypothetical protein